MDRRTGDARQVGKALAKVLKQDLDREARVTELEYFRAERCRICGLDDRDIPNASEVRRVIDFELLNNATYSRAVEAAVPFVAGWPADQRPTYAAVRNHAKRHLKRDQALIRRLMEAYAVNGGIDVEEGDGPILTPGGVLAVIAQKGYERVRDGYATPTVGETILASRALVAIEKERLLAALEEQRRRVRLLATALQEVSPGALESLLSSPSELPPGTESKVVVLPDADEGDLTDTEEVTEAFSCDECATVAKTKRGLLQHKKRKHADGSHATTA